MCWAAVSVAGRGGAADLPTALDAPGLTFSTWFYNAKSTVPYEARPGWGWVCTTAPSFDGVDAAISSDSIPVIRGRTFGYGRVLETTVVGPGTLKFRASFTQQVSDPDFWVSLDRGSPVLHIPAGSNFKLFEVPIPPGTHTVQWCHYLWPSLGRGVSTAVLDQVSFAKKPLRFKTVVSVSERSGVALTGIPVRAGDQYRVTASGSIWAGVWFTGSNGPNGWSGYKAASNYPMPGAAPFSLVGFVGFVSRLPSSPVAVPLPNPDQPVRFFGSDSGVITHTGSTGSIILKINDNVPGNGSGSFLATVELW